MISLQALGDVDATRSGAHETEPQRSKAITTEVLPD